MQASKLQLLPRMHAGFVPELSMRIVHYHDDCTLLQGLYLAGIAKGTANVSWLH